ncbi:hypothetical protein DPQ22_02600 [Candidatus Tokpelaia sp.]|nr:hypothetical protein DPQ22_02600 [Candidatus Tokpelaia sp.]
MIYLRLQQLLPKIRNPRTKAAIIMQIIGLADFHSQGQYLPRRYQLFTQINFIFPRHGTCSAIKTAADGTALRPLFGAKGRNQ